MNSTTNNLEYSHEMDITKLDFDPPHTNKEKFPSLKVDVHSIIRSEYQDWVIDKMVPNYIFVNTLKPSLQTSSIEVNKSYLHVICCPYWRSQGFFYVAEAAGQGVPIFIPILF